MGGHGVCGWEKKRAHILTHKILTHTRTRHTHTPGWADANVAYMQSGGYALSARVREAALPTLVLWGRDDKILPPDQAPRFEADLPAGKLVWVDACGHCAHLEAPDVAADAVVEWLKG